MSKIFLGPFSFHRSSHTTPTTIPLFTLLCTSIHLPSTAPSSSPPHSFANPPCSSLFSPSNDASHRYLLLLHLPPFPSSVGISFVPFQILIQNPFLITLLALSAHYFCWVTLYFWFWNSSLL